MSKVILLIIVGCIFLSNLNVSGYTPDEEDNEYLKDK